MICEHNTTEFQTRYANFSLSFKICEHLPHVHTYVSYTQKLRGCFLKKICARSTVWHCIYLAYMNFVWKLFFQQKYCVSISHIISSQNIIFFVNLHILVCLKSKIFLVNIRELFLIVLGHYSKVYST